MKKGKSMKFDNAGAASGARKANKSKGRPTVKKVSTGKAVCHKY